MATLRKKDYLVDNEDSLALERILYDMAASPLYNTKSSYSADDTKYPDGVIPFVDKHMLYLRQHQAVNPGEYISNLRIMTRIR